MLTYPRKFLCGKFLRAINFRTPITILHLRASEAICVTKRQEGKELAELQTQISGVPHISGHYLNQGFLILETK